MSGHQLSSDVIGIKKGPFKTDIYALEKPPILINLNPLRWYIYKVDVEKYKN